MACCLAAEQNVCQGPQGKKLLSSQGIGEFATGPEFVVTANAICKEFVYICGTRHLQHGKENRTGEPTCLQSLWFTMMPSTPTKPCVLASSLAVSPTSPPASSCNRSPKHCKARHGTKGLCKLGNLGP